MVINNMNINELDEKYEAFKTSQHFPEKDDHQKFTKKNRQLNDLKSIMDNILYNTLFLKYFFILARPDDERSQMAKNYVILVDGKEVALNVNQSPQFHDKENYLKWLHSEIMK
ncbi:hypothetical protein TOL5_29530 [Acinetobacter sp. Tol 5]|nr:hypothetical protein TOL5_29530 [Acinetobacter sp. Tol 5]